MTKAISVVLLLWLSATAPLRAYSVLTHEAVIDTVWLGNIKPVLLKRYPQATPADVIKAHAYAYGGAIIQDIGYYPFGAKLFSDLTHYIRSGDFVTALLRDASDINELAFALGSLAHYTGDNSGHPEAINITVPLLYPKLKTEYGPVVTYEDDKSAHLKTEFGFDVLQVARGAYAPQAYHDFIGFEVSQSLLKRAFADTYGLKLEDVMDHQGLSFGTFRYSVSTLIPTATRAAWLLKKDEIKKARPSMTRRKFVYNMKRSSYRKEWGSDYQKPGCGARLIAFISRIVPKIGPFRALAFKVPGPKGEKYFMSSFDDTVKRYEALIRQYDAGKLVLSDTNMDTGKIAVKGKYQMADDAYTSLVLKIESEHAPVSQALHNSLARYYDGEATASAH